MNILITGNLGYVGASLVKTLRFKYPKAKLIGYDLGFFQNCLTTQDLAPEVKLDVQYYGDVRLFDESILKGVDHVIHLAAISNDPIGNKFEQVTYDVNFKASLDIAKKSVKMGVKSFVFASSCSVYGSEGEEIKVESSKLNPLTPYAKSKVYTEEALSKIESKDMIITCLRFATACGFSDRLRLDLVLNDFVASAIAVNKIEILSDGTPWRPLINVNDMGIAIDWAMLRTAEDGGNFLICNTGSNDWNFTVKGLADHVSSKLSGVEVSVNLDAEPDKRSYQVNFNLFQNLSKNILPKDDIFTTIDKLKIGLEDLNFKDPNFRQSPLMRLNILNDLIRKKILSNHLNYN